LVERPGRGNSAEKKVSASKIGMFRNESVGADDIRTRKGNGSSGHAREGGGKNGGSGEGMGWSRQKGGAGGMIGGEGGGFGEGGGVG